MLGKYLAVSALGLTLLGCNNDNNPPPVSQQGNFYVSDVGMPTATPMAQKDQFTLDYILHVEQFQAVDVDIDFYMIDTSSTAPDVGDTSVDLNNAHMVMTTTIEQVSNGTYALSIDIIVPNTQGMAGDYMIVALVDPNNEFAETNEEDNWPTLEMLESMTADERDAMAVTAYSSESMIVTAPVPNDIMIDEHGFGQDSIIFDVPDRMGDSVLMSNIVGYLEARYSGQGMAKALLHAQVLIDNNWQPLNFWKMSSQADGSGQYSDSILYSFDEDYNEAHMSFDIAFNQQDLETLHANYDPSLDNELTIRLELTPDASMGFDDAVPENNVVEVTIPYYFFEESAPAPSTPSPVAPAKFQQLLSSAAPQYASGASFVDLNKGYNKVYGNKSKVAAQITLEGGVSIDPIRAGGSAYASGAFNVYMFKAKNTIVGVDFSADAYLLDETGYLLEMTFLNTTVFSTEKTQKRKKGSIPTWSVGYEKSWERSRDIVKSRFFVGPIPLSVSAGVSGSVGFGIEAGYSGVLFVNGDLFSASFDAYARGGIDLLIVEAGIQIAMTIIENNFTLESGLGLALAQDNLQPEITYYVGLVDEIDVIKGKFGLYAEVRGIKWCKRWIFYYPCGIRTTQYDFWFYQTPSLFHKEFTLFEREGSIAL